MRLPNYSLQLGTDSGGRDVLSRVVHGSRVSLSVGVLSVLVLVSIGILLGSASAFARPRSRDCKERCGEFIEICQEQCKEAAGKHAKECVKQCTKVIAMCEKDCEKKNKKRR